jgi:chromosome segregation ATPase
VVASAPAGDVKGAEAVAAMNALEPMPVEGPVALFSCLPYWLTVFSARMKRAGIIRRFQGEVQQEQRKLDEILRDLGKRAREIELVHPPLEAAMAALHQLENERAQLETDKSGLTSQLEAAQQKFDSIDKDCNARIQAAQTEASETQAALNEKNGELRSLKGQLGQIDKELSRLAGALRKTQDAGQQSTIEKQIEEQEKKRDEAQSSAAAVDGPVAELTARLADARGRMQEAQKELAAGRQELAGTKRALGVEEQKKGQEMTRLDRAMAEKFLEIGRLLGKDRVQNPALEELYGRIDETKDGLRDRETHMAALSAERDNYDRSAAQKGLILLISGVGLVFLVILTLIILVVFVFD